ncbi:MAG TPA: alpha/beta hydrolase fold domain-containing protein [Polyangiaceae bacterium]|nr:alpha/beta hydrolase fold domain-containing protein [Polyangiaceae bacterium]
MRVWDRALHLGAKVAYLSPAANVRLHGVELVRDVPYRQTGRRGHLLDVYVPEGVTNPPALLYVHGGGFALLSKETHRVMALALARRGYAVFLANYRIGPRHRYPAPLEDAAAALSWVMDHARAYGADASRLVLAGESAGGNLVTALAYIATHARPEPFARAIFDRAPPIAAVLCVYGFLDLENLDRFANPRMPWYVKQIILNAAAAYVGHPVRSRARYSPLASPLRLLAQEPPPGARPLPPFFIACGTADPLLLDSRKLHAILESRGVRNDLSIHEGEIHGFNAMIWRKEARSMWRGAYAFLAREVPVPGRRKHGAL